LLEIPYPPAVGRLRLLVEQWPRPTAIRRRPGVDEVENMDLPIGLRQQAGEIAEALRIGQLEAVAPIADLPVPACPAEQPGGGGPMSHSRRAARRVPCGGS